MPCLVTAALGQMPAAIAGQPARFADVLEGAAHCLGFGLGTISSRRWPSPPVAR